MSKILIERVLALPQVLAASTVYIVQASQAGFAELYFTNNDGSVVRHLPTIADIETLISAAITANGGTGSGGVQTTAFNNPATRYEALSTIGLKVHCLSTSTVYQNLTWARIGALLTVQHKAHGRSVGDRVIVKNTNIAVINALIVNITADSYDVACQDIGNVNGSNGSYTCGFTFSHNSEVPGSLTGGVLSAPANCDIQLHSMRIHTKANSRAGSTYDLTVPTSVFNPAGADTSNDDVYVPLTQIRADADTMTVVGNTIAMNQTGSYTTFRLGALGNVAAGQLTLLQF